MRMHSLHLNPVTSSILFILFILSNNRIRSDNQNRREDQDPDRYQPTYPQSSTAPRSYSHRCTGSTGRGSRAAAAFSRRNFNACHTVAISPTCLGIKSDMITSSTAARICRITIT